MNGLAVKSGDHESRVFTAFDPNKVQLVYAPSPVHFYNKKICVEPWLTIAQTLERNGIDREKVHISLNSVTIPSALCEIMLKPGDTLGIRVVPEDKSMLGILMQIGVLIAAGGAAILTGGIAAPAIVIGAGELLTNMIVGPPKAPKINFNTTPARHTLSADANNVAPWATHPKIHGELIVKPTNYALPYTEPRRKISYLRMLLSPGCGPGDISELKIKNSDISNYEEIQYQLRGGFLDDSPTTLYTNTVDPIDLSIVLLDVGENRNTVGTGWHTRQTTPGTTQISITVSALQGLGTTNDVGNLRWVKVNHNVEYAPIGTDHGPSGDDNWTSRPDLPVQGAGSEPIHVPDTWDVDENSLGYDVRMRANGVSCQAHGSLAAGNIVQDSTTWTELLCFKPRAPVNIKGQALIDLRIRATGQLNGTINDLSCRFKSIERDWDPNAIDPVTGLAGSWDAYAGGWTYDYEGTGTYTMDFATPNTAGGKAVKITVPAGGSAHIASKTWPVRDPKPKTNSFQVAFPGEVYKLSAYYKSLTNVASGVRIRLLYGKVEDFKAADAMATTVVVYNGAATGAWQQAVVNVIDSAHRVPQGADFARLEVGFTNPTGAPITVEFDDTVAAVIDAHSTGPNVIPNASFDYTGRVTSNPASHFRHALQSFEGGLEAPDTKLDLVALEVWHENCVAGNHMFNGSFDKEENIEDVLDAFCSIGRASKLISEDLFSVVEDRASNVVTQVWADADLANLTFSRDFPDLPHAYHTRFKNKALLYQQDEITVCDDGYSLTGPQPQAAETVITGDGITRVFSGKYGARAWPVQAGSLLFQFNDGSVTLTDNGDGTLSDIHGNSATIDYKRGWMTFNFVAAPAHGALGQISYNGYDGTIPATRFEALDLSIGVTDLAQAFGDARWHLIQARARPDLFAGDSDIEMIKCQRGDRCLLQSRLLAFGKSSGRVGDVSDRNISGDLLGVTLDEPVHMELGKNYSLRFRIPDPSREDITIIAAIINPGVTGDYSTVTFVTPILAAARQPSVGDLFVFFLTNQDVQPVRVSYIDPQTEYKAKLQFIADDPAIYDAENRVPPATSDAVLGVPSPIIAPVLDTITSNREDGFDHETGAKIAAINITLKAGGIDSQFISKYAPQIEVWYKKSGATFTTDRGEWNVATSYNTEDLTLVRLYVNGVVQPNYDTYWVAQQPSTGVAPLTDSTETYWAKVYLDHDWIKMSPIALGSLVKVHPVDIAQAYDISIRYITNEQGILSPWLYLRHTVTAQELGLDAVSEGATYGKSKRSSLRNAVAAKEMLHLFPTAVMDDDGMRFDVTNVIGP